jgi:signal transduction histidine kinase
MLTLASLEGDRKVTDDTVALNETILAACDQIRPIAALYRVDLRLHLTTSCTIQSEEGLLQTLWTTLIENAIRYSPPDSIVTVRCSREEQLCVISVQDHGLGIAQEHLPHIFERFYRADLSRSRDTGGFGLGLAIAKAIVDLHGGHIDIESAPGKGTAVSVTFAACKWPLL